jgi:multiple antibiotic resistance protein
VTEVDFAVSGGTAGLAAVSLTIFLSYAFAGKLVSLMRESGINVLTRLSAFILLCIGIQIVWAGVSGLLHLPEQ